MKTGESEFQSSRSLTKLNKIDDMWQSPENRPNGFEDPKGVPIYFDYGRELTDIAEEA